MSPGDCNGSLASIILDDSTDKSNNGNLDRDNKNQNTAKTREKVLKMLMKRHLMMVLLTIIMVTMVLMMVLITFSPDSEGT